MDNKEKKVYDGRVRNGGYRKGAGRPKGSGIETVNVGIRLPRTLYTEFKVKGQTKLNAFFVTAFANELQKIPSPVQPVSEETPVKKTTRKKK